MTSLNCNGHFLDLTTPLVMGILNVTPDSFYDGGKYNNLLDSLKQVESMIVEGARIIDIGGMSSRPGAPIIAVQEEVDRVVPIVREIIKQFPTTIISIDTVRSEVAEQCLNAGAHIINDISAGSLDARLWQVVASFNASYVLMHMKGKPDNMQNAPVYENVLLEVLDFMVQKIHAAQNAGIKQFIIDPGFGFGKTITHNYELLKSLSNFKLLEYPILAGISRKSMIYKVLKIESNEALNGTSALHMVALQQGAKILRVHDVKEAVQVIKLWQQIKMDI